MSNTNTIVQVQEFSTDPVAAARIVEVPIPEPRDGEVLVQMYLRPVNPADIFSVQGKMVVDDAGLRSLVVLTRAARKSFSCCLSFSPFLCLLACLLACVRLYLA